MLTEEDCFLYLYMTMITNPCVCRPGPRLSEVFNDYDVFRTHELKGNIIAFTSAREKALDGLIRSLFTHFVDVEEDVLEAAQSASLQTWPDSDDTGGECHCICAIRFFAGYKIKVKCSKTVIRPSHEYFLQNLK